MNCFICRENLKNPEVWWHKYAFWRDTPIAFRLPPRVTKKGRLLLYFAALCLKCAKYSQISRSNRMITEVIVSSRIKGIKKESKRGGGS